jgi:DmsE family decaheme c-type cytochrome
MKHKYRKWNPYSGILLIAILLMAAASVPAQSDSVDDETCMACHDDKGNLGVHELASMHKNPSIEISCVSCHSGGETHVDDPSVDNIGNPGQMLAGEVESVCTECHQPHMELDNIGFDPHVNADISCTSCHSIHGDHASLLRDDQAEFCGGCHTSVLTSFQQRSNHPLADGNVTCVSCHDFTGQNAPMYAHGENANCFQCHPEQGGPFLYEHEAASSFSTEGSGCVACHMPHGSPNDRLLTRTDDGLCQQCHGVPPGHLTAHNGSWAGFACMECHVSVHGSYDHPRLLDQQLGTRLGGEPGSCFCHGVDN